MKHRWFCLILTSTLTLTLVMVPSRSNAQNTSPDDHVALTDLAYVALTKGHDAEALTLLQQAIALAPEDPRAHLYLAVAFYRLGRVADARRVLGDTQKLDVRDPLPWLAQSMVDTDGFSAATAVAAAQQAHARRGNVQAADPLFTDLRGSANAAYAFQFAGLTDWAEHVAQESFSSPEASSHLFLGQRYAGVLHKRSELFQGMLADPTAIGASPRFQSLVPKAGPHATAAVRFSRDRLDHQIVGSTPSVTVNGLIDTRIPIAYAFDIAQQYGGDSGELMFDIRRRMPERHIAIGLAPSPRASVIATIENEGLHDRYDGPPGGPASSIDYGGHRVDVAAQYRFTPTSALSLKMGTAGADTLYETSAGGAYAPLVVDEYASIQQLQVRHAFKLSSRFEVSWGAESSTRRREIDVPTSLDHYDTVTDSDSADISGRVSLTPSLSLDTRLGVTRTTDGLQTVPLTGPARILMESVETRATPRLGFAYRIADGRVFRIAAHRWVRSASDSTLAPVTTAGLPPDDTVLAPNGLANGGRAQLEWTWNAETFVRAFVEHEQFENPYWPVELSGAPETTYWGLQRLLRTSIASSGLEDGIQHLPPVDKGRFTSGGLAWNRIVRGDVVARARYTFTASESPQIPSGSAFAAPMLPRQLVSVGGTWTSPRHIQVSADATYRSERLASRLGGRVIGVTLDAGWAATVRASWEPANKQWSVDLLGQNLGRQANAFEAVSYSANVRWRY